MSFNNREFFSDEVPRDAKDESPQFKHFRTASEIKISKPTFLKKANVAFLEACSKDKSKVSGKMLRQENNSQGTKKIRHFILSNENLVLYKVNIFFILECLRKVLQYFLTGGRK